MKRVLVPILMVSLLFIAHVTFAQCPSASQQYLIYTEGTAEVTGQNDSATVSVAVVTEGKKLDQVSSDNAVRTKAVLGAIKGLNIKNLKLETSNYRVTPQKDYKAQPPVIKGYEVHNSVLVTLEKFAPESLSMHVSQIVGKALENGANSINHIQFYIKNKEPLEKEALTLATQEAIDRAKILAQAAGVKLKRIASLSTRPTQVPPRPMMMRKAAMDTEAAAMAPPIEIGESEIRVQVTVAYEIE
jgi:uncharacterized protein